MPGRKRKKTDEIVNSISEKLNLSSHEKEFLKIWLEKFNKYKKVASTSIAFENALKESINTLLSLDFIKRSNNDKELDNVNIVNSSLAHKVEQIKHVFPEIGYLEEVIASLAVFNLDFRYGLKSTAPGILYSIILKPKSKKSLDQLNKAGTDEFDTESTNQRFTDSLIYTLREEIYELIEINDTHFQLLEAVKSILEYGCFVVNFSEDYRYFTIFNLADIKIEKKDKKEKDNEEPDFIGLVGNYSFSMEDGKVESSLFTPVKDLYHNADITLRLADGTILDISRTYIVSNSTRGLFGKSRLEKIYKYCRVLYILEIANLLERLSKSKFLNLIVFDVSELEDEDAAAYTSLYSNIIKNKASVNINENGDQGFDILRSIIDNFAIIPVEGKDKLRVEQIKNEYKPTYQDIDYYWEKIYFSLGIPPFYRTTPAGIPKEAIKIHDIAFSSSILQLQSILNKFLTEQIRLYFINKGFDVHYISISIPKFTPIAETRETDIQKIERFVKIAVDLQNLLGITFKQSFILSFVFPEYHPSDIADGFEDEKHQIGFYTYEDLKNLGIINDNNQGQESENNNSTKDELNEVLTAMVNASKDKRLELDEITKRAISLYKRLKSEITSNVVNQQLNEKLNALGEFITKNILKNSKISDAGFIPFN